MCGICGELRFDQQGVDRDRLANMVEQLERRGPDDEGLLVEGRVGLGHRRLKVIDLSDRSHQPMRDDQLGLQLVFNGAIYNYRELREELGARGYRFFSEGDTEVIIKAYKEWGEDCAKHLHGMFAFAIWDQAAQSLFVCRDRFGIKPFYFSHDSRGFRFASNIQSLLASGEVDTAIDPAGLHFQFTLHGVIPAPRTLLQGVRKLEPGTWKKIAADGSIRDGRYWDLQAHRPTESLTESQWIEGTREHLREAIRRRNDVADVPVGVLLSGGLDSSLLVAMLADHG
ncbi:MAG: asparagine synthase (glutamine-hydrolyzing), partial [bacterium]